MAVAGAVTAAAIADTAGHRYADFHDARATIDVAGPAVYDPQAGYTAECRIWMDSAPIANDARFPASIMFAHQSGVDHKWLAVQSGKATGIAVDSTGGSWWNRQWLTSNEVIPLGRWVHLAYVIGTDGLERMYVDGQLNGTQAGSALRQNGANIHLGAALMADFSQVLDSFGGELDWIRISSVARYNGPNFAVPTEDELVPDAPTNLLVTFNGNSADDAFIDLSPHHYTLTAGAGVSGGKAPPIVPDCNGNVIDDRTEVSQGLLPDSNGDGVPDGCQCGAVPELPVCCVGDIVADRVINGADLGTLLAYWGPRTSGSFSIASDLNNDGRIDGSDLGILLAYWGACPTANVPAWATLLETQPDPAVVTDAALRAAIVATGLPWRVRDTGTGIEMLLAPPGTFEMGCSQRSTAYDCYSSELPVHQVNLMNAFYIGRYEVTQAQWFAKMGSNPSQFQGATDAATRPVEKVSWTAIQSYLTSTNMRLPTEAEWEFACRAGTNTPFYNGSSDDSTIGALAWYNDNSGGQTHSVGGKAPNALGLHDMLGNVWEWVNDWYGSYATSTETDPAGPTSGTLRCFRGGAWFDPDTRYLRSSSRGGFSPQFFDTNIGFRVARNP
jgi:formylglycine-generating enzyme required for sulfatase activity